MRSYRPEELFDDDGAPARRRAGAARPRATGGWAPTRTPTAALLLQDLRLPDFRDYAVDVPQPAHARPARRRACSGAFLRDVIAAQPAHLPPLRARRDRLQPPRRRLRGHRPRLAGRDRPTRRPPRARRPRDGGAQRAPVPGLARGLPAHRPPRAFNCYEAFIHIVDSMFNQHAKWLKVTRGHPVAAPDRLAQLPADLARLAPGPQRLLAPGPGLHRPRGQQEGRVVRVYLPPDANCLLSVADHCLRSRDYVNVIVAGKQPALDYLSMDDAIVALHARARHLGLGEHRRRRRAGRRPRPAPATCRRWRRWPPPRCCASTCPT